MGRIPLVDLQAAHAEVAEEVELGFKRVISTTGFVGGEEVAAFEREYAALAAMPKGPPQTLLYCIWQDPWMTVSRDTYIANMMALANWRTWQAPGDARYPQFRGSDEVARAIDGVLLSSEPYRFTEAHADALERQIGKPVQLVDGEMMSWYGSRAIRGLHYLRTLISGG